MSNRYSDLPHIFKIKSLEELPSLIRSALTTQVHVSDVSSYLSLIEKSSFEFDYLNFILNYQNSFYHGGNLVDVEIDEDQMNKFLLENKNPLETLANAYIEKINYFEHNSD